MERGARGEAGDALTVADATAGRVHPVRVYLVRCAFEGPGRAPAVDPNAFVVDLALIRERALDLTVHLTVATAADAAFALSATFGADYRMSQEVPEEERDALWRRTAYELAAPLLYPYLRELFRDLTGRSLATSIDLPLVPVPLGVSPENQAIPAPPAG